MLRVALLCDATLSSSNYALSEPRRTSAIKQLNSSNVADSRTALERLKNARILDESAAQLALDGIQYDCDERPNGLTISPTTRTDCK